MTPEQIGEAMFLSIGVEETIVVSLASFGQLAAQRSYALDVPTELDFFLEKPGPRLAILQAFLGEGLASFFSKFGGCKQLAHASVRESFSRLSISSSLGSLVANEPVGTSPAGR